MRNGIFSPRVESAKSGYNRATNVSGATRRFNVFYEEVDPLQGEGIDYGLRFSLFHQKLVGTIAAYETTQTRNFSNSNRLESRGVFWNGIRAALGVIDPDELLRRDSAPESWVPIFDSTTKGHEVELVWNPTRNLRVRGTYSTHENIMEGFGADMERYLEQNRPVWQAFVEANYDPAFAGSAIPNRPTPAEQRKLDGETVFLALRDMDAELPLKKALNGIPTIGVPEWQSSVTATYAFPRGSFLQGWAFGGSARTRGEASLAFETSADGAVNKANSIETDRVTILDLHAYYTRKLWKDRLDWRIQANVRNIANDTNPIYLEATWDWNTRQFVRGRNLMQEPRSLVLSTSFSW